MAKSRATRTIEFSHVSVTSLKAQSHDSATAATARNVSLSHKVACTGANTTQTKAGNGRNDCAEFTHAPTKSRCTIAPNQTQHKQKPATAAMIVRNLPTHPQVALHHRPKPNTTIQTKAGNGRNDCAEFTHAPKVALPSPQPKHNNTKAGNGRNDCAEFTHAPTKLCCTTSPNTTQTKAGNRRNDCVEFTHAPTSHGCTTSTNTTQTKAGNGRNDCAEFTHAPSRAARSAQTQIQTKNNPAMAALIMRNFRMVDTKSQQAKTS